MQEQLDRIEKKLDNLLKLMNPIVEIDKALRADILRVLSHGKKPRKQPLGKNWFMCSCGHTWGNHTVEGRCTICKKDNCWKWKVAQDVEMS